MLEAAREAEAFTQGRKRGDLDRDRQLALALTKDIEIVGEAASRVSATTRQELAAIPWERIIGMRNRLVHVYFDIDRDILWQTARCDLPKLISLLESAVSSECGPLSKLK